MELVDNTTETETQLAADLKPGDVFRSTGGSTFGGLRMRITGNEYVILTGEDAGAAFNVDSLTSACVLVPQHKVRMIVDA